MKTLRKHTKMKGFTLFLSLGLLLIFTGCTIADDNSDPTLDISMYYELPVLDYEYDSLEPYIDATTMEIHHSKHHNSYTNNLNAALESHPELQTPLERLLANPSLIPADIRTAVLNNGGGYYNHALFFSILEINNGQLPSADLGAAIIQAFGSFDQFKEIFANAAITQFGSGWAWLIVTNEGLAVVSTSNQDTPLNEGVPILCIDVWEHAYYLNYQNKRAEYVAQFFHVINWEKVAELYVEANN